MDSLSKPRLPHDSLGKSLPSILLVSPYSTVVYYLLPPKIHINFRHFTGLAFSTIFYDMNRRDPTQLNCLLTQFCDHLSAEMEESSHFNSDSILSFSCFFFLCEFRFRSLDYFVLCDCALSCNSIHLQGCDACVGIFWGSQATHGDLETMQPLSLCFYYIFVGRSISAC
ncbi:hypothetical protein NE237_031034 [Protea cynaroides]|uniref:Uncharacterized protein n=1 Tax=Protea cynaroides TaxID=273540 RepID=A0A9Q0GU37_9MAGN|nr:hypothetical protein NE237_031034 [Protea cynaroides]